MISNIFNNNNNKSNLSVVIMDDPSIPFEKKAKQLKKEKKFEEALIFEDKVKKIRDEEKSVDFWYKRGLHFVDSGEFEKAIDCFDKDISKRQRSYDNFFAKGKVLFTLTRYDEALECFNKAAEERNQHYLHTSKKADHLKKARKFEKALLYKDMSLNDKSIDAEFWYYKGITLLKLKKYDDAHSCISNALESDDANATFLYDFAKCELFLGNESKCIDILKKLVKRESTIKDKLRVDEDFKLLLHNQQFQTMIHLQ